MITLIKHELKENRRSFIIWLLCVGGLCFFCITLYKSLEGSLEEMAQAYSSMGSFSTAFGMDRLSLATLTGFYATEIGMIHGLGGAMFASLVGTVLLSKEEEGHTSEFLNTLPIRRSKVIFSKWSALFLIIVAFNIICSLWYVLGFIIVNETVPIKEFLLFHLMQTVMQLEIGCICFLLSACSKKNKLGAGLGISILFFAIDMMSRIIPAIEELKYITPFYYSNASDIFYYSKVDGLSTVLGVLIIFMASVGAFIAYQKKDLAT